MKVFLVSYNTQKVKLPDHRLELKYTLNTQKQHLYSSGPLVGVTISLKRLEKDF